MRRRAIAVGEAGRAFGAVLLGLLALATPLAAQTDYYNLDHGRPLRVEDAYAAERYGVELKLAPLTLAGDREGGVAYTPALELKHGLFPGFEIAAGISHLLEREGGVTSSRAGEAELSALLNLNTETLAIPALALRATAHLPLEGGHDPSVELKAALTRTLFGPVRAHVNGAAVLGADAEDEWWAGAALDYVLPFRATLLLLEGYAVREPGVNALRIESTLGLRRQLSPTLGIDAGIGRGWNRGDDWRFTLGLTTTLGVRALVPTR